MQRKSAQAAEDKRHELNEGAKEREREAGEVPTPPSIFASVRKLLKRGDLKENFRVWFVQSVRNVLKTKGKRRKVSAEKKTSSAGRAPPVAEVEGRSAKFMKHRRMKFHSKKVASE